MNGLSILDVVGILIIWIAVVAVGYVARSTQAQDIITIAAIVAAYYLSKWIILKKES